MLHRCPGQPERGVCSFDHQGRDAPLDPIHRILRDRHARGPRDDAGTRLGVLHGSGAAPATLLDFALPAATRRLCSEPSASINALGQPASLYLHGLHSIACQGRFATVDDARHLMRAAAALLRGSYMHRSIDIPDRYPCLNPG